jgi:DNA modification methylase
MREFQIIEGNCLEMLRRIPDQSVHCCVTSPPYWGLRDYGVAGQFGLERTPEEYVTRMVDVFREVRRVLRDDGTLWLNLGDSYTGSGKGGNPENGKQATNQGSQTIGVLYGKVGDSAREQAVTNVTRRYCEELGMAPKNLVGIPWRVAFSLQADGWYLRSDIIWYKLNPMPESVTDRPTRSHEYLFLMAKSERYFFDGSAIAETAATYGKERMRDKSTETYGAAYGSVTAPMSGGERLWTAAERNKRDVWPLVAEPCPEAHFATMPTALVEPCVMAGCPEGGTVLDPFAGSGTVGVVATRHARDFIGIELNPEYAEMARRRIMGDAPMFNSEQDSISTG